MNKILFLLLVLNNLSCIGQSTDSIEFSFPFDRTNFQIHEENLLKGASYLLLVPYEVGEENKGRIINIAWYESQGVTTLFRIVLEPNIIR